MAGGTKALKNAKPEKGKRLGEHAKVEPLALKVTSTTLEEIDALRRFHEQRNTHLGAANTVSAVARDALEIGVSLLWIEAAYPELRADLESFRQRLVSAHVAARERVAHVQPEDRRARLPKLDDGDAELIREVLGRDD